MTRDYSKFPEVLGPEGYYQCFVFPAAEGPDTVTLDEHSLRWAGILDKLCEVQSKNGYDNVGPFAAVLSPVFNGPRSNVFPHTLMLYCVAFEEFRGLTRNLKSLIPANSEDDSFGDRREAWAFSVVRTQLLYYCLGTYLLQNSGVLDSLLRILDVGALHTRPSLQSTHDCATVKEFGIRKVPWTSMSPQEQVAAAKAIKDLFLCAIHALQVTTSLARNNFESLESPGLGWTSLIPQEFREVFCRNTGKPVSWQSFNAHLQETQPVVLLGYWESVGRRYVKGDPLCLVAGMIKAVNCVAQGMDFLPCAKYCHNDPDRLPWAEHLEQAQKAAATYPFLPDEKLDSIVCSLELTDGSASGRVDQVHGSDRIRQTLGWLEAAGLDAVLPDMESIMSRIKLTIRQLPANRQDPISASDPSQSLTQRALPPPARPNSSLSAGHLSAHQPRVSSPLVPVALTAVASAPNRQPPMPTTPSRGRPTAAFRAAARLPSSVVPVDAAGGNAQAVASTSTIPQMTPQPDSIQVSLSSNRAPVSGSVAPAPEPEAAPSSASTRVLRPVRSTRSTRASAASASNNNDPAKEQSPEDFIKVSISTIKDPQSGQQ